LRLGRSGAVLSWYIFASLAFAFAGWRNTSAAFLDRLRRVELNYFLALPYVVNLVNNVIMSRIPPTSRQSCDDFKENFGDLPLAQGR
jgi:ABC-type uncharacterized transport system permease subunit